MRSSKMLLMLIVSVSVVVHAQTQKEPKELPLSFVNSSRFHVEFGGAVVHLFNRINKAVALKIDGHKPELITSLLTAASRKKLKDEFGVDPQCDSKVCTFETKGLRVEIVASEGGEVLPAINTEQTIDLQVPHLRDIALDKVNHPFNRLSDDVIAPQPKGPVAAIFVYRGGTFRSHPFEVCKGDYDPPVGVHTDFTAGVTLDGLTTGPAVLEVSSAAHPTPVTLEFVSTNKILIGFGNSMFGSGCRSHLEFHNIIAFDDKVKLPTVKTHGCVCIDGLAPGCSNTQWP